MFSEVVVRRKRTRIDYMRDLDAVLRVAGKQFWKVIVTGPSFCGGATWKATVFPYRGRSLRSRGERRPSEAVVVACLRASGVSMDSIDKVRAGKDPYGPTTVVSSPECEEE
jgi:hypothetical protein